MSSRSMSRKSKRFIFVILSLWKFGNKRQNIPKLDKYLTSTTKVFKCSIFELVDVLILSKGQNFEQDKQDAFFYFQSWKAHRNLSTILQSDYFILFSNNITISLKNSSFTTIQKNIVKLFWIQTSSPYFVFK